MTSKKAIFKPETTTEKNENGRDTVHAFIEDGTLVS